MEGLGKVRVRLGWSGVSMNVRRKDARPARKKGKSRARIANARTLSPLPLMVFWQIWLPSTMTLMPAYSLFSRMLQYTWDGWLVVGSG